jgi:pyruvate-formate lyase-activating enzyme
MPPGSGFAPLEDEPTVSDVVEAVVHAYNTDARKENKVLKRLDGGEVDPGIVFSGAGDPLLRLDALLEAATRIRDEIPGVKIRLSTNGVEVPRRFRASVGRWPVELRRVVDALHRVACTGLVGPSPTIAASLRDADIAEVAARFFPPPRCNTSRCYATRCVAGHRRSQRVGSGCVRRLHAHTSGVHAVLLCHSAGGRGQH